MHTCTRMFALYEVDAVQALPHNLQYRHPLRLPPVNDELFFLKILQIWATLSHTLYNEDNKEVMQARDFPNAKRYTCICPCTCKAHSQVTVYVHVCLNVPRKFSTLFSTVLFVSVK